MQKVWQWFRDRKTNTVKKWRSVVLREDSSEPNENGDGQFCGTLLDPPDPLHPIGGSDNALTRRRSENIRRQQRSLFDRLSSKLSNRHKTRKKKDDEDDGLLRRSKSDVEVWVSFERGTFMI